MFQEYIDAHGVPVKPHGAPFPPCGSDAWAGLDPALRSEILDMAKHFGAQAYPMRRATDFLAFVRNGSRKADEDRYFLRRRKLCAAALGYCVQPDPALLDEVIDGLWCICEESSWVISAHNVNPIPGAPAARDYPLPDTARPYVDLFAAQTGMILALVCSLAGSALDAVTPMLRERAEQEIRARVLTPFMTTDEFWWMGVKRTDLCNWTPWIISNVMIAAECLPADNDLAALLARGCVMLDRWLKVVPEDGGCDEGAGYWNMAGGALLDCLDVLERVTGGEMTFRQDEKLRRILCFPARARVRGAWFWNFADCDAKPVLSGERLQHAGALLGEDALIALGAEMRGSLMDEVKDTPHFSRLLYKVFNPPLSAQGAAQTGDVWLPDLQVRKVERGRYILCAKGGHNGESHNHNDVGSFMLYIDGEPALVDAGNMTYTAKTFSDERYTLWNVRGAYHNLPLIGGEEQQPGTDFRAAEVVCLPDGLRLDASRAYAPGVADAFLRRMTLDESGFTLQDVLILPQARSVEWIFMLRSRPEIGEERLTAGGMELHYGPGLTARVEELPVTDPRMARNFPGSLWRVSLTSAPAENHALTVTVR